MLFSRTEVLDPDKKAEVYLYTALAHFANNDLNKAHQYLGNVLFQSKQYFNLPVFQTFRMLHLPVHYELQNYDVVFHAMRSVKRSWKSGEEKIYLVGRKSCKQVSCKPHSLKPGLSH